MSWLSRSKPVKAICVVSLLMLAAMAQTSDPLAESHGNVHFFLGLKNLSESDWEPVENQRELGVEVDFAPKEWPIHIATDLFVSRDDEGGSGLDVDARTWELGLGVRKVWYPAERLRPYFGGGLAIINAEVDVVAAGLGSRDDDDTGIGAWVGGGIFWRLSRRFNLGMALRYSQAEVDLFDPDDFEDEKVKAGGIHFGALVGWEWPAGK